MNFRRGRLRLAHWISVLGRLQIPVQVPRPLAIAPYFGLALAGAFFMFWFPTIGLRTLLGEFGFIIWNAFLIIGGAFGMVGTGRRQAQIEIVSVPLLWSATWVYGGSLLPLLDTALNPGALAGIASIFFSVGFMMLGRGWELWKKVKVSGELDLRATNGP